MKKNKLTKEEIQTYLLQKEMDRWIKDNPKMMEDISKLVNQIMMMNIKWGTRFEAGDITPFFKK